MSLRRLGPRAVLGLAAPSGTGKTTLLEGVLADLSARGLRVAVLKHHAHPGLSLDVPGKDSWRLRQAGAWRVTVASDEQHGTFSAASGPPDPLHLAHEYLQGADLVLAEGFRASGLPSLLLHRHDRPPDPRWQPPAQVCAVVTSDPDLLLLHHRRGLAVPHLPLDVPAQVAAWIVERWLPAEAARPPLTVAWLHAATDARVQEPLQAVAAALGAAAVAAETLWEALVQATTPEVLVLSGDPACWPSVSRLERLRAAAPEGCDAVEQGDVLWCGPRCLGALHAARLQPGLGADWRRWAWIHTLSIE